jgi:hypothetical protein
VPERGDSDAGRALDQLTGADPSEHHSEQVHHAVHTRSPGRRAPDWCTTAACRPTPDWGTDGLGFVAHYARLLDVDGLLVEVAQGETISPQGDVLERDPAVILCEGAGGGRELTADQAALLADALVRAAAAAGAR